MKSIILFLNLFSVIAFGQTFNKKEYLIEKTKKAPKIDGLANDQVWNTSDDGSDFICVSPFNGRDIKDAFQTNWKATYDNQAIYFLIEMNDPSTDSILRQLSQRDRLYASNADQIEIMINPYNDGLSEYSFTVSASGVQADTKRTQQSDEPNWNEVWNSKVKINDNGWTVEIKIPYSALRFPKKEVQDWGFNVRRNIRRVREFYSWNYIDASKENISDQAGTIVGLSNIDPPIRLGLYPYISNSIAQDGDKTRSIINGGLDIKYGINESFTLDMTLIPDFGQAAFDNQVLNLSPFEIRYDEKRSFFIEGTEILKKGGLFYSRRISDNLLNATKVTGRNSDNLGIGILNAVTSENEDDEVAMSNYNVFVLDKTILGNSSITLTNTNVQRKKNEGREANATGMLAKLKNKKNSRQITAKYNVSQIKEDSVKSIGFTSFLSFQKISGSFQYEIANYIESDTYNPNDLGLLRNNNENSTYGTLSYRIVEPTNLFVNFKNSISLSYNKLYAPGNFTGFNFSFDQIGTFKNYLTWGLSSELKPVESNDYFEAREGLDQVFIRSKGMSGRTFLSSDYRKRFALDASINFGSYRLYDSYDFGYRLSPRFRVNDKLFLNYVFSTQYTENDFGYHTYDEDNDITVFAIRKLQFFTNVLKTQYVINNKMSFDLKFRHHWQKVTNASFHEIDEDGYKVDAELDYNDNTNYNAWNIDFSFSYRFAPGSELTVIFKNAINTNEDKLENYYRENIQDLLENEQENRISLKLRYYLDYQKLKKK